MRHQTFEHEVCHEATPGSCHCYCEEVEGAEDEDEDEGVRRGCDGGPGVLECVAAALLAERDAAEYLQVLYC